MEDFRGSCLIRHSMGVVLSSIFAKRYSSIPIQENTKALASSQDPMVLYAYNETGF